MNRTWEGFSLIHGLGALIIPPVFTLALFFLVLLPGSASAQLPQDFQDELVISDMNQPVSIEFLPDGRALILQKGGEILISNPQAGSVTTSSYMTITNINSNQERGLLDITLDPNFESNGYFYVYYSPLSPKRMRISRFVHQENSGGLTSTGDLSSEYEVWREKWDETYGDGYVNCCHFGAGLDFGPDDKLYVTPGDKFIGSTAQDKTVSAGSIIRINSNGTIPNDNPFYGGATTVDDDIWAYGLRNPFRARWDIPTERLFVGEVGGNDQNTAWEDLHLGREGANYGWPYCEGYFDAADFETNFPNCDTNQYDEPIFAYRHSEATPNGGSITGGFVMRNSSFPFEYEEAYFYGDYARNFIRYLTFSASDPTQVTGDYAFQPSAGTVVSLTQGPEGALYYLQIASGSLRRIKYTGDAAPIITDATANPTSGLAPLSVNFSGSATDSDSGTLTYTWRFGDGTSATGQNVSHTYLSDGAYTAFLEVFDGTLTTASDPIEIQVGEAPTATITDPIDGMLFRAGDIISFGGTASGGTGSFTDNDYSWTVRFGHNDHYHPVLDDYTGMSGSFEIPTEGHGYADDTRYEILLTVTDDNGLTGTDAVAVFPDKVNLSFDTSPSGIPITIDDIAQTPPFTNEALIDFQQTVSAPASHCINGTEYTFSNWSHAATREHTLTVPSGDASYLATYTVGGDCSTGVPVASGLVMQLETDQGVAATEGVVTGWADQSSSGNDLTAGGNPQFVASATPAGQPAISFDGGADGSGDKLERLASSAAISGLPAGSADRTMFFVGRYNGASAWGGAAYGAGASNEAFGLAVNGSKGKLTVQGWGGGNDLVSTVNGVGAGWTVQSAVLSSDALTHYQDGTLIDSWTHSYNTTVEKVVLGEEIAGLGFIGMDAAAVLVYDRALSETERQEVEQYLQDKYLQTTTTADPATIAIGSPTEGETLSESEVTVAWTASGDLSGADHVHVTLDDGSYISVTEFTDGLSGSYTLTEVAAGSHTVKVELVNANHSPLTNPEAIDAVNFETTTANGNEAPVASADAASVVNADTVTVDVLANDSDSDGTLDPATVVVQGEPTRGAASVDASTGAITYIHDGSSATSDSLTYTVADNEGAVSNAATVLITITSGDGSTGVPVASGLVMQLETDQGVAATEGVVTGWADQSSSGNDLTAGGNPQFVASATPAGQPAISFDGGADGSGDKLERLASSAAISGLPAGSADRTMFFVGRYNGASAWGGAAYGAGASNEAFGLAVNGSKGKLTVQGWGGGNDLVSTVNGVGAGWTVQSAVLSSDALTHYQDGTLIDSWTHSYNTTVEKVVLGEEIAGLGFIGMDAAAVLVYDRALSETERQEVEQYLQDKYLQGGAMTLASKATLLAPEPEPLPESFALLGNYPNPFRTQTTVAFDLPQSGEVIFEVYDVMGRRIVKQVREMEAGSALQFRFEAGTLASGFYLYRLTARLPSGTQMKTGRMVLVQ